jgi:putative restriction endonuclease
VAFPNYKGLTADQIAAEPYIEDSSWHVFDAPEGAPTVRSHRRRERSREQVRMAKAIFRQKHGRLFCQVCEFDFGQTYGEPDFIEVHHLIPLRELKPGDKTKLSDLTMVCPNCHRMLHRGSPWPTIEALRATIRWRSSAT